ncbi:hypothetical protein AVEN_88616-1 [Araneus ventricosus]|uniref:Uncharacterized protein n=1 Tax=Araneus ventricosus TaxID=182803 RepID=A0A4Y2FRP5_ARAVE|nr:hypothetical protein AVEN_88616-1 [Araneus ventricosus]
MVPAVRRRSHRLNRCGKARKANNDEHIRHGAAGGRHSQQLQNERVAHITQELGISVGNPPCDFHMFDKLKEHLGGRQFSNDDQVQRAVLIWPQDQGAIFYRQVIERLVQSSETNVCRDWEIM